MDNEDIKKIPDDLPKEGASERLELQSDEEEQPKLTDREVMEHTASIWRYCSIIDDGTEQHTEYHAKYRATSGAEIIAARARGKKHKHEGSNCDDWFETAESQGCIICVVSDGAGSKPLARIGARVCCEAAVECLKKSIAQLFEDAPSIRDDLASDMQGEAFMAACGWLAPLVQCATKCAFDAVQDELTRVSADERYIASLGRVPVLNDLSSTFLAAVIIPLTVGDHTESFVVSVQIGDGCICAVNTSADAESCIKILGNADSGAYSGETDFLSEKNTSVGTIASRTRISRGRSDLFMLMTDGVADDYFPNQLMMKRLYLDLCLNGILPLEGNTDTAEEPAPIRFPSVSMSQRSVELQYAKQLLAGESSEEAVNALWEKRSGLMCHSLEAFGVSLGKQPQEKLLMWLDNYNERGSFDDRTLVAIRVIMDKAAENGNTIS